MPKMKTKSALKKRLKRTASGKLKRGKAMAGHVKTKKNSKRKRHLRTSTQVSSADFKRITKLLP